MTGVILTLVTAATVSALAALIVVGGTGEPVRVQARDNDEVDQPSSDAASEE